MTLSEYVGRRLGRDAKSQLANFLARPFGAATLAGFWQYWNPVLGYYLSYYFYRPLERIVPRAVAVVATFGVCGAAHDVPLGLLGLVTGTRPPTLTMTAMFVLLGILVVASQSAGLTMARWPVAARWAAHAFVLAGAWWTAAWLTTTG